jgi:hypothetical protein
LWAAGDKLFHIVLVVFRLTEGRTELLIIIVYLFWELLTAPQLEGWSSVKINQNCPYDDTKEYFL